VLKDAEPEASSSKLHANPVVPVAAQNSALWAAPPHQPGNSSPGPQGRLSPAPTDPLRRSSRRPSPALPPAGKPDLRRSPRISPSPRGSPKRARSDQGEAGGSNKRARQS
jgi:hypothetical protein